MSKNSKSDKQEPQSTALRSFYREYRPQKFEDVIGQDQVVKVLGAAIENKKTAHAYLFAGTRGTGKTTVARLFAYALNTAPEDIYEIDAASHTSVDHMRELNESVSTLPFRSQFKVYILDEVHMLSKAAFNAFLKTLEEPPAHVIFILATTETEKVPETIVSRCQVFQFKTPSTEILEQVITKTAKAEKLTLEKGVAQMIALAADGSFRDAQGALQKVASVSKDDTLTTDETALVLGAPKGELIENFIHAYVAGDVAAGLSALSKVREAGVSFILFGRLLLLAARNRIIHSVEEGGVAFDLQLLPALIDAEREARFSFMPELPYEAALMKRGKNNF